MIEHLIRSFIRRYASISLKIIDYLSDRVTHGELEILAYVRVEFHDIDILNGLILPCLIVETHCLGSTPVQGITFTQRTLLYYGLSEQFGPPCIVKLTMSLDLEQVSRSRYLSKLNIICS